MSKLQAPGATRGKEIVIIPGFGGIFACICKNHDKTMWILTQGIEAQINFVKISDLVF